VLSAWVLVGVSAWCLAELAKAGRAHWGGTVYAGVGGGIALAGLLCLGGAALKIPATDLWWQLGAVAALPCAATLVLMPRNAQPTAAATPGAGQAAVHRQPQWGLVICYGCFGFGYILPATFLPALARAALDDPAMFGWAWPVFGIAAAVSTVLASTFFARTPRVQLWVVSQFVMAAGTMLPAVWPSATAVLISAALVGGTFMVITMAGLQEARLRAGANPTWLLGQLTAAFAFGQIAGPVSSALLGAAFAHTPEGALQGIRAALLVASAVLAASAWWLLRAQAAGPSLASSTSGVSK
jgi:predicted MFS family arabinose efflux permease